MQKKVFTRIELHYKSILKGDQVEALQIMVIGTADTGKSYLIKAICQRLCSMAGNGFETPILVITPTGITAFNINSSTIYSMLFILIFNKKSFDLNSDQLKQLQERLKNVIYFIIDEKSMVDRKMLTLIDMRLREAFSETSNVPFGG